MEQKDYRDIWQEYDKKLDKHIKLNTQLIENLNLDKTRSEVEKFIRTPMYGSVFGIILLSFLVHFMFRHIGVNNFIAPAALISLFVILQIVVSIFQTSAITKVNYDSPITVIQKKLGRINLHRIRYLTVTRFSYPLLWVPVLIVGSKAIFNVDLYLYLEQWWIWLQIIIGIFFLVFGVWLSKQYANKKITSNILNKLMGNITKNDITGKNLIYAISFLEDVEKFEREM